MQYLIQPPTERAKRYLGATNTVEDAVFLASLSNVPEIEIYEAWHYYTTVTLPAVQRKPWKRLCRARLEKRLKWLESELARRTEQYRHIRPFSARKQWYEEKIKSIEQMIVTTREQMDTEPVLTWNIPEINELKRLGVERYLHLYVDRFYPLQESAV